ncbi:hypothetical protein ACFQGT_18225 [Natrialbaceae archaeon GCM10025810]|uniref:DUF7289 family protein n=1 Tax=Halovalidus salilacus TaxID=3075124 RepID=UPI00361EEE9A
MDTRGVSSVIGFILLVGMVSVVTLSILYIGGVQLDTVAHHAEQEQVEHSFIEVRHQIESVSNTSGTTRTATLEVGEQGAVAYDDAATYEIWTEKYDGSNRTDVANGTIGTIEYESPDGTTVAYEGSGVFRKTSDQVHLLSAPSVTYNQDSVTLNFFVPQLTENKALRAGDLAIEQRNSTSKGLNYIEDDHVFVAIESNYCDGWEEYFETQAGDTTVQEDCYGGENADGEVEVKLGYEDVNDAFESGLSVPNPETNYEEPKGNNGEIELDDGEFPPLNSVIDSLGADLADAPELRSSEPNPAGNYSVETMNDAYTFNLSEGDALVYVNGSVSPDEIEIENCDETPHSLTIYAQGDFDLRTDIGDSCSKDAIETIQFYGTNTSAVSFQDSSSEFRGLLYVAGENEDFDVDAGGDHQVQVDGAGEFDMAGAIIAQSVAFGSAANDVDLKGAEAVDADVIPDGHEPAPQILYLNVLEKRIEIENQ